MTFTYTPESPTDVTRVRFHTGQTVAAESLVSDEEITYQIAEAGTWQKAVIAVLKFIMARLSQPDFKADWLEVDLKSARDGYSRLLAEKRQEFGVASITSGAVPVYRSDSDQSGPGEGW